MWTSTTACGWWRKTASKAPGRPGPSGSLKPHLLERLNKNLCPENRMRYIWDFEDSGLLIRHDRLICDFCSSNQRFACGFLQIPPRGGHPCRPANSSPCRACRGLSPPSGCALPGAPQKRQGRCWPCLDLLLIGDVWLALPEPPPAPKAEQSAAQQQYGGRGRHDHFADGQRTGGIYI